MRAVALRVLPGMVGAEMGRGRDSGKGFRGASLEPRQRFLAQRKRPRCLDTAMEQGISVEQPAEK